MNGYLGEFPVNLEETEFKGFTPQDWALDFIERYGQYDGGHHKQWTMDQVVRILKGTPVIVVVAKWENGTENYRINTGEPSKEYLDWVKEMEGEYEDGHPTYEYDEGIAP